MLNLSMLSFLVIGADLLKKTVFENFIHLANRSIEAYSLSDLVGLTAFFPQKVCFCLPNLANFLVAVPRVCINILYVSTPQNVDFAH